jgi:hypothetical protein
MINLSQKNLFGRAAPNIFETISPIRLLVQDWMRKPSPTWGIKQTLCQQNEVSIGTTGTVLNGGASNRLVTCFILGTN